MRQAVLVEPKHIEFREVEAPKASDLKEHQVLLNIKRIGICGSEIHSYHGCHPATFYPVVQGHEYSAVVVATGMAVTICKAGDVVTARPQLACGKCKPCQRGEYNICEELRVQAFQANGAAQDFFVVDDDRIAVLPEGMSLDYGAMIEPVAVAAHATMRGGDLKGKNVVVSGAGTIGNLVAQFAKARGAKRVLITDVSDFRLEIARKCGIVDTLNVAKTPLKEGAKRLFGDEDFQAAFEVAGVESSIRSLMECIGKGSTRCRLSLMTTWILHWRLMRTVCMSDRMIWRQGKCEKDLERIRSSEFRHTRWRKRCALKNAGRLTLAPVLCLEAARKKMWER